VKERIRGIMAITTQNEIWKIIKAELARDEWIPLQNIYSLIETNLTLKVDDFLPSAPTISEPRWMRNVRNVLQHRKINGDIAWDRNGKYMIPSSDISVADDSIVIYEQSKPKYTISEERFRAIQTTREQIGLAGENWVVESEKQELSNRGHTDLAVNVKRIAETNIAAGYDVLSFEDEKTEKFIEVNTTALSRLEFYLSSNELDVAREFRQQYWIYFISEIFGNPNLVKIQNPVSQIGLLLKLSPTTYRVQISP
jgi:hypothetical protein